MTYVPDRLATAPSPTADVTTLVETAALRALDYRCGETQPGRATADTYPCLTLVAVREGGFCYHDHGYTRLVEPGSVLLGCGGEGYACSHEYGCGDRCFIVQFSDAAIEAVAEARGRAVLPRSTVFAPSPRLEARLREAMAGPADEGAYRLLDAVLEAGEPEVPPSLRRDDRDRAHAAARYLERHLTRAVPLDEVAAHVATSLYHFVRLFQQELGLTPHQYLIRARLREALRLLSAENRAVTEVAFAVGFHDVSHFSRTFSRHVGASPQAYRCGA